MISEDQMKILTAGGHNLFVHHSQSGLWSLSRVQSNAYLPGRRTLKSSSFNLALAVEDLVDKAERAMLAATTAGRPA